jgi:hypothetical protein
MNNYLEFSGTVLAAFLGGTCAFIAQWYFLRKSRFDVRRNVLFYLLEMYAIMYRLEKIKIIGPKSNELFNELGLNDPEARQFKSKIMGELFGEIMADVFDDLDDLNELYPKIVVELSKENPILAYTISSHGKALDKILNYIEAITESIKKEVPENEHDNIDNVFAAIFQNDFVKIVIEDVHSSIILVSKNISYMEARNVRSVLKNIEDSNSTIEEMNERFKKIRDLLNTYASTNQ